MQFTTQSTTMKNALLSKICHDLGSHEIELMTPGPRSMSPKKKRVASPSITPTETNGSPRSPYETGFQIVTAYRDFFARFDHLRLDPGVFVHFSLLLKSVLQKRKTSLSLSTFRQLVSACFFISIKFVVDEWVIHLDDFVQISGVKKQTLEKLELGILFNVLAFNIHFRTE